MTFSKAVSLTLALLLTPGLLSAQDVTGLWDITAKFTLATTTADSLVPDCEYSGKGVSLTQSGSDVTGTVDLNLDAGSTLICPGAIISGQLMASLKGTSFFGTLDGGNLLGSATVQGTIATAAQPAAVAAAATMLGGAEVTSGPFVNSSGSFNGQQLPVTPTLAPVAIGILALILFGGTVLLLTRRERVAH